ncbi:MAG: hypothetical protein H0T73_08435 [Ardenticatenales bacterium]|nr:hypothetical protein [Ardenticatenales bacterium]
MLDLFDEIRLGKVGEAILVVEQRANGGLLVDGGDELPELTGILIDSAHNRVKTPYGMTTTTSTIEASEEQRTGPWNGTSWKLERVSSIGGDGILIEFAIGQFVENGRGIIYYRVREAKDGVQTLDKSFFLNFDKE